MISRRALCTGIALSPILLSAGTSVRAATAEVQLMQAGLERIVRDTTPGLYLTADKSHASLVNQPSTQVENGIRVIPGNAEESILHKVINPGNVLGLGFSHENMITSSTDLRLIDEWINAGAKE